MTSRPLPDPQFHTLYPDVDPRQPVSLRRGERLALATAAGLECYGQARAHGLFMLIAAALLLLVAWRISSHPARRLRQLARARFPHEPWSESQVPARRVHLLGVAILLLSPLLLSLWCGLTAPAHQNRIAAVLLVAMWLAVWLAAWLLRVPVKPRAELEPDTTEFSVAELA